MLCACCVELLKMKFSEANIKFCNIEIGRIIFDSTPDNNTILSVKDILVTLGMDVIEDRESQVIEITKNAVFDLVHRMNNMETIIRKSEYLVEKTGLNYQSLSKLFSKHTGVTLEKYIILNKIERIKELIDNQEYTLTEIAYMMDYSSVHYLSSQFKLETGYTVSEYKKLEIKPRKNISSLV